MRTPISGGRFVVMNGLLGPCHRQIGSYRPKLRPGRCNNFVRFVHEDVLSSQWSGRTMMFRTEGVETNK